MKRILVATDFSTRSDRALRRAVLIAGQCGAALTLVHVVDDDQPADLVRAQRNAASELLAQTAGTIGEVDGIEADSLVLAGDAFAGILATAEEIDAGLIMVGPHRRQLSDVFTGTTAERTIRRSTRPVLMANGIPSGRYERSLLAVDLDDSSRAAARAALGLGIVEETRTLALHLFDAPALGAMKRTMEAPEAVDHYLGSEERRASSEFADFLESAGLSGIPRLLKPAQGSIASVIISCAEEQRSDLIVVGTSRPGGVKRFLLGSVAQDVLLEARCDVLVVPPEGSGAAGQGPAA